MVRFICPTHVLHAYSQRHILLLSCQECYCALGEILLVVLQTFGEPTIFVKASIFLEHFDHIRIFLLIGLDAGAVVHKLTLAHVSHQQIITMINFYYQYHVQFDIQMSSVETHLFPIQLPQWVDNFKNLSLQAAIPIVDSTIAYIQNADSAFLMLLLLFLLIQLYRSLPMSAKSSQAQQGRGKAQNKKLGDEIRELKKQMASIQKMLVKLQSSGLQQPKKEGSSIVLSHSQTERLIKSCKESWQKRDSLVGSILQWQTNIVNEVTKLKKKNRSSRSPSKNQISSSKQFSAQSKKSIKSTIHNVQVEQNKNLFKSDIKIKEEEVQYEKQEEPPTHTHEQTLIQIKIQNEEPQPHSSTIKVEVHQQQEIQHHPTQLHQAIPITPSFQPAPQKAQEPEQRHALPPPPKAKLPLRPPTVNKPLKKLVPPPRQ